MGVMVEKAPWAACVVGQFVYLACWCKGVQFTAMRAMGDTEIPNLNQAQSWVGLVAWEYFAEVLLIFVCARTIFPRWPKGDIIAHHLPFSLFVFAAMRMPGVWIAFRWTQCAVLLTQGNEVLECFQTCGGEAALHYLFGLPVKSAEQAKASPGLVERMRLVYALFGITHCVAAEIHDISCELIRVGSAAAEEPGAMAWDDLKNVLASLAVLPALYLHITLVQKYFRRVRALVSTP